MLICFLTHCTCNSLDDIPEHELDGIMKFIKAHVENIQANNGRIEPNAAHIEEGSHTLNTKLLDLQSFSLLHKKDMTSSEVGQFLSIYSQARKLASELMEEVSEGIKANPQVFGPLDQTIAQQQEELRLIDLRLQPAMGRYADLLARLKQLAEYGPGMKMPQNIQQLVAEQPVPLSLEQLRDITLWETSIRYTLWLGLTPSELLPVVMLVSECSAVYVVLRLVALWAGVPLPRWPALDVVLIFAVEGMAYRRFVGPLWAMLRPSHIALQIVSFCALAAGIRVIQHKAEGLLRRRRSKRRRHTD